MRVAALIKRIIFQMIHDKRTLALMMVAPLVILTLMNVLFKTSDNTNLKIGTYKVNSEIVSAFKDNGVDVEEYSNDSDIKNKIEDNKLAAFISMNDNKLDVTYENSDPSKTAQVNMNLQGAMTKMNIENLVNITKTQGEVIKKQQELILKLTRQPITEKQDKTITHNNIQIESHYIYGNKDTNFFDTIIPVLVGFFVFFFVFLISGIALLKERTTGTLDRLLSTPIKRSEVVFGYLIGYGIFAVIQTVIVALYTIYGLKVDIVGSLGLVLLTNVILAFVALSFGVLLSTFANSEFQMMQFIPIAIIPQIFFAGIIPVDGMANWLQVIAKFIPMYYAGDALQGVILKGYTFSQIQFDLLILLIFAVVFIILNIVGLKRYRKV
ncbi:ABC transporter permease [Clostridium sardiniense]|uniref:ABC transporter permease n=1 Tax=Clostridium sardiniense TaxID=29369 RepID=UPI003D34CCF3